MKFKQILSIVILVVLILLLIYLISKRADDIRAINYYSGLAVGSEWL